MRQSWLRLVTVFLVVGMFTGCATNVQVLPPVTEKSTVPPGSGVVLLQVADTTPSGRIYPVSQVTFAEQEIEVEEEKYPRVIAQQKFGKSTRLFIGILPEGRYALTSLRSFHQVGDAYFSRFYPADIELGTFKVEANKVTDLGALTVFIDRTAEDYRYSTTRVAKNDRGVKHLVDQRQLLAEGLSNLDAPLSWEPDGKDRERQSTYRRAVNRQVVTGVPFVHTQSGAITFPSRLGMLIHRNADQQWSLSAFDDDVEIPLLAEIEGTTVIVTEFNELYYRQDGNAEWQAGHSLPEGQTITFVGAYSGGNYLVSEFDRTVSVWTNREIGEKWQLVNSLKPKLGFFSSLDHAFSLDTAISRGGYVAVGDELYLAAGDSTYRYTFQSNKFADLKTPKVNSIQQRNGTLTISSGSLFTSNKVSFDGGQTWRSYSGYMRQELSDNLRARIKRDPTQKPRLKRAKFIGHPIFINETTGLAIHQAKDNREDTSPFMIRSDNAGNEWYPVEGVTLPKGCADLELADENEILLRCFLSGEFYRSDDFGESWVLEREVSES